MGTNYTASANNGADDEALAVSLTYSALAISIVALVLSTLQALLAYLQFDNSEVGRRRCSEEVMGELWAGKTTRKFKWQEWRYQVFFEVPVFYTAPPGITVGPLTKSKPKVKLLDSFRRNSDADSDEENSATIQEEAISKEVIEIQKHVQPIYKITGTESSCKHTLTKYSKKDEKWANVHTAEDEGCSWVLLLDALQGQEKASREWDNTSEQGRNHTICYLIQRKRRCWDFMPLHITKPFATTTICHLVEMMSMLGLIWKEFNIKASSLSAEGNGYMVKSESMAGLGILARFSRLSKAEHKENRIVPCEEIKRLCFGEVPSLFDTTREKLQVGPGRLEHCLKRLLPKLDHKHRKLFLDVANRPPRPLMFPCTFELIAMLAKSVHIPGSRFRRLPNPCADMWTPGLDIAACLSAFAFQMEHCPILGGHILTTEIQELFQHGRMDALVLSNGQTLVQKIMRYSDAASRLRDERTERNYYPADARQTILDQAAQNYDSRLLNLLDSLHWAMERVDERLKDLVHKPEFREVVAFHLAATFDQQPALNIELANAAGGQIEEVLINFYVNNIYPAAVKGSEEVDGNQVTDSASSHLSNGDEATLSSAAAEERSAIWWSLMFRMWAWLFLHDFNPEDKMIERSEFKDSRLPVYIG